MRLISLLLLFGLLVSAAIVAEAKEKEPKGGYYTLSRGQFPVP